MQLLLIILIGACILEGRQIKPQIQTSKTQISKLKLPIYQHYDAISQDLKGLTIPKESKSSCNDGIAKRCQPHAINKSYKHTILEDITLRYTKMCQPYITTN